MKAHELFEQENEFTLVFFELDLEDDDEAAEIAEEVAKRVNGEVWESNFGTYGRPIEFQIKVPHQYPLGPEWARENNSFKKVKQALRRISRGKIKFSMPDVY
ncbi:hypothetical protein LCGC14_0879310 [marine sediment metagenome]|uniref:Uncharacterized protein n=1 Tax=marine sediment metagenome TaxID=412755 RepID=A0A0F9S9F2_9ZZZZ